MAKHKVVICTDNTGYEVSLERRKLYEVLPDEDAAAHGQARIVDESGEDYLYPESFFTRVNLPEETIERIFDVA